MLYFILPAAALVTSMISAVIGMAGGVILLAIMLLFLPPQVAIPIHAAVQLISNGSRTVVFLRHVEWRIWGFFCMPAVAGILVGRLVVQQLDPQAMGIVLGSFILLATWLPKPKSGDAWPQWIFCIAGALAGTLGMLVGAVGPIIAPFFLHTGILKERLIATKAVCQATVHICKIIAFGTIGFAYVDYAPLLLLLGITVLVGTILGKRILRNISDRLFSILFKVTLTLIAIKLLLENI